jgi:hypothetical protein
VDYFLNHRRLNLLDFLLLEYHLDFLNLLLPLLLKKLMKHYHRLD